MDINISGCLISPLKIIPKNGGEIRRALTVSDKGYNGFAEIYFSSIEYGFISDWKKHKKMTLNLVVPLGNIQFSLYDNRSGSSTFKKCCQVTIGENQYYRLTVSPGIWVAFRGLAKPLNMLANIANIEHDPNEADREAVSELNFYSGPKL